MNEPTEPITVLGVSTEADRAKNQTETTTESVRRRPRIAGVALLVVVSIPVMASILRTDDTASLQSEADLTEDSPPAAATETTLDQPATTFLAGAPFLGEATGLSIAIGAEDELLRIFDLDTGELTTLPNTLRPVDVSEGWLFSKGSRSRFFRSPLDPDSSGLGEPVRVADVGRVVEIVADADPRSDDDTPVSWIRLLEASGGRIWIPESIATGERLERVNTPPESRFVESRDKPLLGPGLINSAAGGVFALQPDNSYLQVLDGNVVAANDRLLLVSQCDSTLTCELLWFDRDTFDALGLPPPAVNVHVGIIVDDRLLVAETTRPDGQSVLIIDIKTGDVVQSTGQPFIDNVWISQDGRWLAQISYDDLRIVDIDSGVRFLIPDLGVQADENLVFISQSQRTGDGPDNNRAEDSRIQSEREALGLPGRHPTHGEG